MKKLTITVEQLTETEQRFTGEFDGVESEFERGLMISETIGFLKEMMGAEKFHDLMEEAQENYHKALTGQE